MLTNNRLKLHEILCGVLGSGNVYFQPPESIKMKYPAIVYSLSEKKDSFASGKRYLRRDGYSITVIDKDPDSSIAEKMLDLDLCRFDRAYAADGLNHFTFKLYF